MEKVSGTPLLQVQDLHVKFFTDEGTVHAVSGVSLTVEEKQTLGIVGESGCGKSVTSLAIMRLIPPPGIITTGAILFRGEDLLKKDEREMRKIRGNKIAMIFQDPMTSLNPVLTIGYQVQEAIQLHQRVPKEVAVERTIQMLRLVRIPDPEKGYRQYPHQFSGGMRQRVMIAMALSCHPDLLIADEPTTALDVTIQAQILDLMQRLQAELKTSVILITHNLGIVAQSCDEVIVMYAGQVVEHAPVEEIFREPKHPYTIGLLSSLPRLDSRTKTRLSAIPGQPPHPVNLPPGCPFAPRCPKIFEPCIERDPLLYDVSFLGQEETGDQKTAGPGAPPPLPRSGHRVRCFLYERPLDNASTPASQMGQGS